VLLAVLAVSSLACDKRTGHSTSNLNAGVRVQSWGELRAIMHAGDRTTKVGLGDLAGLSHLYAIGALSELRGEVTVVDGKAWLAYPGDGNALRVQRHGGSQEKATLLVAAQVPSWQQRRITEGLADPNLDEAVVKLARASGLDTRRPFPFLIEGRLSEVSFHVIDGRRVPAGADHGGHLRGAVTRTEQQLQATIVGFYSERHAGVFTHMGERTHLHVVASSPEVSGHVDAVTVAAGSVFKVPR
jgi:alpha-acetolactate decarboxylase